MRAEEVLKAGTWAAEREVDRVRIDFDRRHRRRIVLRTMGGAEFLLDLARAERLAEGDGLCLVDGGVVRVLAEAERLLEIRADQHALVRIAWHLGNRHLPVQMLPGAIRIREDHVIEEMVRHLGARTARVEAAFDPEAGAYAGGHSHDHHDDE